MTRVPLADRFWPKVDRGEPDECWLWVGAITPSTGYGAVSRGGRDGAAPAHRVSYELTHGPIPEGLEIDHLCRVRACVNPAHLEAVTHAENMRRAMPTHCVHGHEYTPENTAPNGAGKRRCRTCRKGVAA